MRKDVDVMLTDMGYNLGLGVAVDGVKVALSLIMYSLLLVLRAVTIWTRESSILYNVFDRSCPSEGMSYRYNV